MCIEKSCFVCCCVSLSACGKPPETYTVQWRGRSITVNTVESTITSGPDVIKYDISRYGMPYELHIYYPDGSSFWWQKDKTSGGGGWSGDYSSGRYIDGMVLVNILESGFPEDRSDKILLGILLLIVSLVHIFAPVGIWACCFGMYRSGEPDEGELIAIRILGGLILLGTAAWFFDWFA